jgi:K+-sensing histidine kinase KdpD
MTGCERRSCAQNRLVLNEANTSGHSGPDRDALGVVRVVEHAVWIPNADRSDVCERSHCGRKMVGCAGTGLGRAVRSHIVERHGGQVEGYTRPGEGSAFTMRRRPPLGRVSP